MDWCPARRGRTYTGTRDAIADGDWFESIFGFKEEVGDIGYAHNKEHFIFSKGMMACTPNGAYFKCGIFEVPALQELLDHLREDEAAPNKKTITQLKPLTFRNVVGDTRKLHLDDENAGAVFQASSLFNCLETGYGFTPEDGVTRYANDATQGPAAAIACPSATVFRNYLVNGCGQGGGKQLNCLSRVDQLVKNDEKNYWTMRNGYCLPKVDNGIRKLSQMIVEDKELQDNIRSAIQVGIHWDTEVAHTEHCVCQVLCSALPVGVEKKVLVADWLPLARLVLESVYEATLTVASILTLQRGERVKVYLTAVGGGWFGNRREWIADAIDRALRIHSKYPLDVMLVHYAEVPTSKDNPYFHLERGRQGEVEVVGGRGRTVTDHLDDLGLDKPPSSQRDLMHELFTQADLNGDGVLDRSEFSNLLQALDSDLFTPRVIELLLQEADACGDGVVHYYEFVGWLCGEDSVIKDLVLSKPP